MDFNNIEVHPVNIFPGLPAKRTLSLANATLGRSEQCLTGRREYWKRSRPFAGERWTNTRSSRWLNQYLFRCFQIGIRDGGKAPLFRSAAGRTGALTDKPMNRIDAYRMIRRRAADLGTRSKIGCHTFRATGITAYLEAGGTLENAQAMAAHESPRTTKLYDRAMKSRSTRSSGLRFERLSSRGGAEFRLSVPSPPEPLLGRQIVSIKY